MRTIRLGDPHEGRVFADPSRNVHYARKLVDSIGREEGLMSREDKITEALNALLTAFEEHIDVK